MVDLLNEIDEQIQSRTGVWFNADELNQQKYSIRSILECFVVYYNLSGLEITDGNLNDFNQIKADELKSNSYPNQSFILISKHLMVMTAISPKRETFLEKVGELTEQLIEKYLDVIETYLSKSKIMANEDTSFVDGIKADLANRHSIRSLVNCSVLNNTILLDEKINLGNDYEKIDQLKKQIKLLISELKEKDIKIKDLTIQIEKSKEAVINDDGREDYYINELMKIEDLKNALAAAEVELINQKDQHIHEMKQNFIEINYLKSKLGDLQSIKSNEQVNQNAIITLQSKQSGLAEANRRKLEDYEGMLNIIKERDIQVQQLEKEKNIMLRKVEIAKLDCNHLNERLKEFETDNIALNNIIETLKEQQRIAAHKKDKTRLSCFMKKETMNSTLFNQIGYNLSEIESSICQDNQPIIEDNEEEEQVIVQSKATSFQELKIFSSGWFMITETHNIDISTKEEFKVRKKVWEDNISNAARQIEELRIKLEVSEQGFAQAKADILQLRAENLSLLEEITSCKAIEAQSCKNEKQLCKELSNSKAFISSLQETLKEQSEEIQELKKVLEDKKEKLKGSNTENVKLEQKIILLREELSGLVSSHRTEMQNMETELQALRTENQELSFDLKLLNKKLKEQERQMESRDEKIVILGVRAKENEKNLMAEIEQKSDLILKLEKSLITQSEELKNENEIALNNLYSMALKYYQLKAELESIKSTPFNLDDD